VRGYKSLAYIFKNRRNIDKTQINIIQRKERRYKKYQIKYKTEDRILNKVIDVIGKEMIYRIFIANDLEGRVITVYTYIEDQNKDNEIFLNIFKTGNIKQMMSFCYIIYD
jgi:hypothetical protein